jgi:Prokaryotic E2 family A/ThiF family/Prokaryotic homologs of the JAB domain
MTMPHDWLQTWGNAIEPDQLSGSFAVRFRDFLKNEASGLASIMSARRLEGSELLTLDVETNRPQRPAYPILHREPLAVVFYNEAFAPVVLSLRPDFPDTPHQNWVPEGFPFSLCVDDRPWQEALPLYTPAELLHRIVKWFERAGRGGLHDMRQPLDPFFMRQGIHVVMPRNVFELDAQTKTELIGTSHDLRNPTIITLRAPQPHEQNGPRHGAFLFVAFRIAPQAMSRMRRAPRDLASLIRELSGRGIDLAGELIARITAWSAEGGDHQARFGSRLGILLQMPIIGPDGVTTGETDSVAFLTASTTGDIGIALGRLGRSPGDLKGGMRFTHLLPPAGVDETVLAAMPLLMGVAHVEFDQPRALELSGKTALPLSRIVQIGAGTIGSLAAESLVREGFGLHWTFIDPDYLLPHNLARHDLGVNDVGLPKALSLASRVRGLRSDVLADGIVADVLNPAEHRHAITAAIASADLIIDAAASVPVARFLCDQEGEARRASIFFNPAGTSVVLLMESRDRSINLRMLEAAYYGDILTVPELQDHLSQSAEAVPYAGACRAVTNRMPAGRAQILTGLVTTGLTHAISKPDSALHVWSVSANSAIMVHSPDIGQMRTVSCLGWTITLPQRLEERILQMRRAELPAETGGVLFGVVDLVKSRIDIVEAWGAPPGSQGSETEFIRGTKGLRQGVEEAIARTLDQVRYVGEWHSHPRRARTTPSGKDLLQLGWLASTLSMDGCPGLMLIAGDEGVSINLGEMAHEEEVVS